jgi:hypothetical protein
VGDAEVAPQLASGFECPLVVRQQRQRLAHVAGFAGSEQWHRGGAQDAEQFAGAGGRQIGAIDGAHLRVQRGEHRQRLGLGLAGDPATGAGGVGEGRRESPVRFGKLEPIHCRSFSEYASTV